MKKSTLSKIIIAVIILLLGAAVVALVAVNAGKELPSIPGTSTDNTLAFDKNAKVLVDGQTEVKFSFGKKTLSPDDYVVKIVPTKDDFYISQGDTLLPSSKLDADRVNACFTVTKKENSFTVSGPDTYDLFFLSYFGTDSAEVVEFSSGKPFKVVLSYGDKTAELPFSFSGITGISLDKEVLVF